MSWNQCVGWGAGFFLAGLALAVAIRLPALVGGLEPLEPLVAENRDPQVPGERLILYPDGLVLAVEALHPHQPQLGAPTLAVTVLHYGDEPVTVGFAQFLGVVDGGARPLGDGQPAFGTRLLEPRQVHHGRLVLPGAPALEALTVVRDGQTVTVTLTGETYEAVESVTGTLFDRFSR